MSDETPIDFEARDALFGELARVGQALSNPHRLRLLSLLGHGDKPVEVLAQRIGQSLAATSAHLKVLRACHLVRTRRDGKHVIYGVADSKVLTLWLALREAAEAHLPEVRELMRLYRRHPERLERLDTDAVVALARDGEITLLDLRPPDEYAAGHLPGARSIPFAGLEACLAELPRDRRVVAYCRGPYCVMAVEGTAKLLAHGLTATRLPEGALEWRAQGRPLSTPTPEA